MKFTEYIKNEVRYQNRLKEIGFISTFQYLQNIPLRVIVRIVPDSLRGVIYKIIRKKD